MKRKKQEYGRLRGDSGQHRRILLISLFLGILAFLPVAGRLVYLMVSRYDTFSQLALRNQTRTTAVTANRGQILDRNMNVLACSESVETLYLDPHELKQSGADLEKVGKSLADLLELDAAWIVRQGQDTTKRYKQIASRIGEETAAQIRQYIRENDISGIHLEPNTKRVYPYGSLAAQVIGFTDNSNTGAEGIEAAYDPYLSGEKGKVITTKGNNEMDMPFSYENYVNSREGCSVVMTLDATVQSCLEKQMENAIARYDVQNGAFGMVMNAKTGEILAMATLGSYDPNDYQKIADPEAARSVESLRMQYMMEQSGSQAFEAAKEKYEKALTEARLKQWRNRCISDGYEPGSTFKLLTMSAALDCGAIDLETDFYCGGSEQIPGRSQRLHCWRSVGHGAEKTPQALQNSCNIAFAHIALKLGGERFYEYVRNFGIMEKTGIDLAGESKGVFFDRSLITDTEKWGTASLTSGSFGQTFKLTPIQLVRGVAAVVNGGNLLEPYVVSEVLDSDGNTVLKQEPTVIRQVISEETSVTMRSLMQSVVEEGTAKNAQVAGFSIGGKTGTSEKIDVFDENGQRVQDKIVSFVGVAPMDDPEYIVLVALDTPSRQTGIYISGGVMAAPTVGAVFSDILPYLGVAGTDAPDTVTLEDMTGMTGSQVQAYLTENGVTAQTRGSGDTVTGQIPAAGQVIPAGTQVIVYFGGEREERTAEIPDFLGMTRSQAYALAGKLGLSIIPSGNESDDPGVIVTAQREEKGMAVSVGSGVHLEFTDPRAAD